MMRRVFLLAASLLCLLTLPVQAQPKIGETIPGFDTMLLDGKTLSAESLKGKPVLVMFWATWCPICRKEMPDLQAFYERYRDKGFTVLALSIDAEQIEVDEFWKDHRYTISVGMRTPRHSELFGVTKYPPRFFLIDRQGVLRYQKNGAVVMEQLEEEIAALLKP
jgi:peroxiredoxin